MDNMKDSKKVDELFDSKEASVEQLSEESVATEDSENASKKSKETKKKGKGKKIAISVLCVFLAILIIVFTAVSVWWNNLKKAVPVVQDTLVYDFDEDEAVLPEKLETDPVFEQMYEGDATDLKGAIRQWATNGGDIMYSKDVINVLCVGVDTRNQNTVSGLTDSMVICSVNTKLGTITFTSIMRDSYAYLESPSGEGHFNKINSAFPFYGIENLIGTIESHFKIRIDGYAMINFALFKALIDKCGGVTVPVQQYEADYLNGNYPFNLQAGSAVTLNGDQALAFCRSRKCDADGDVSRTRRQRSVLVSLLQKFSSVSAAEIPEYIATMLPYVQTNYKESELLTLGTKAVVGGWANFSIYQLTLPDEASRKPYNGETWYWEVDYPLAAQTLQKRIYGETNIVLAEDRVSPLDY